MPLTLRLLVMRYRALSTAFSQCSFYSYHSAAHSPSCCATWRLCEGSCSCFCLPGEEASPQSLTQFPQGCLARNRPGGQEVWTWTGGWVTKARKQRLKASQVCKRTRLIVIGSGAISSGCRRAVAFQNVLESLHNLLPAL